MKHVFAAFAVVGFVSAAPAQVTTTRIANVGTAVPGGTGETFASISPLPSIDGSTVAFYGTTSGHGSTAAHSDIYASTGGLISYLVHGGAPIPNGAGDFSSYDLNFRYQNGIVVFTGYGAGQAGEYTYDGSTFTRFADLNTAIPNGTGNFTSVSEFPSTNGSKVVFAAGGSSGQAGIYLSSGGATPSLIAVADKNTQIPRGAIGNFTAVGINPSISGNNVAFRAGFGGPVFNGVYMYNLGANTLSTIADSNTPLPGSAGNFSTTFQEPTISGANVAFTNNNGVYAEIGGTLKTIADTNTPSPDGTGNFTSLEGYAPISGDEIAFIGTTATTKGVYLYDGTALQALLTNSNPIFDGQVLSTNTPFQLGPDAISGNSVAFGVDFASGSGVYEATFTPVPEPSTLALVGLGALALFRRRLVRRSAA